jgi:hypothetical protein
LNIVSSKPDETLKYAAQHFSLGLHLKSVNVNACMQSEANFIYTADLELGRYTIVSSLGKQDIIEFA